MRAAEESFFVKHTACPSCGSSDANSLYSDGHTVCFACRSYSPGEGAPTARRSQRMSAEMIDGEVRSLPKRGIGEAACQKYGYRVGQHRGRAVQIADYRDAAGHVVAQHTRTADKDFAWVGDASQAGLWGRNLWQAGGKRLVITEGEIDCLSVAQCFGLSWPVVSLPNGAQSAKKAIQRDLEWIETFEQVVLAFDSDDAGRAAAAECAPLLSPGKVAIAEWSLKDANDVLQAGGVKSVMSAIYQARIYRPDGIVSLKEIRSRVLADPEVGYPWPWPTMSEATFGRRLGEVWGIGAGTGVGKTDLMTQAIAFDLMTLKLTVGVIYLEQDVGQTGKRIAGKVAGKRFHVPDGSWTQAERDAAWDAIEATDRLHLYDNFGALDWETVESKIRYMVVSLGCKVVYLDHMTALAAAEDDERKALEKIMASAASLAKSLNFILIYVSHLATPEGRPHEENGRVMIRHFKGSRALGYWSHFMIGLERNCQADTAEERAVTTLRILKDRHTGNATGLTVPLIYDRETGMLNETTMAPGGEEDASRGMF